MGDKDKQFLRGISTVRFHASDLAAAQQWYTEVLGVEPYFARPGYIEFRLGDYQHELGIVDSNFMHELGDSSTAATSPSGTVVYWHVDDVQTTIDRLIEAGAKLHETPRTFGGDFVVSSVVDPFGNILGIMYNPHYLEIFNSGKKA